MKKKLKNPSFYQQHIFAWMTQLVKLSLIGSAGFLVILVLLTKMHWIDEWNGVSVSHLVKDISSISKNKQANHFIAPPYRRKDWHVWSSMGRCGNTRMQVLIRDDLTKHTQIPCKIQTGLWIEPYTGKTETIPSRVDIDHIVPLKYANNHGGFNWSVSLKKQFANDWDNLLVANRGANRKKGYSDILEWQPPNKAAWYSYAQRWQFIHLKYDIPIPKEQKTIIQWMSMFDESTNPVLIVIQLDAQSWISKAWIRWKILLYHLLINI